MIMPIFAVDDVDAAVAFYKDKLGFTLDMTMAPEGKTVFAVVSLSNRSSVIGLGMDDRAPKPPYAPGVQFMIYLPDNKGIDEYYAKVQANGVKIDDPLTDTYWGDRAFSVHDPNGYWLTFTITIKQMSVEEAQANLLGEREQQT